MSTPSLAYHTSHVRLRVKKRRRRSDDQESRDANFVYLYDGSVAAAPGHIGKICCSFDTSQRFAPPVSPIEFSTSRTEAPQARGPCTKTFTKLKKRSSSTLIVVTHVFNSAPTALPQRAPTYCGYMIRFNGFTGSLYHKSKVDYQLPRRGYRMYP